MEIVARQRSAMFVRRAALASLVLLSLAAAALWLDVSVARVFEPRGDEERYHRALGPLTKFVNLCEVFGYGGSAVLLALVAARLDPAGMRALPRLLTGSLGAGLAADVVKLLAARLRPKGADLRGTALETFQGWLPVLDQATRVHTLQSFPSAHTATAFGLATVLATRHPRGIAAFYTLAALSGLQRVQVMDHFVSDVLAGAAVGMLCGAACVSARFAGGWFDRLELASARHTAID
jgi:membrane-associated phospholipid phosphatase